MSDSDDLPVFTGPVGSLPGRDAMAEIQREFGEYYKSFRESQAICNALHADLIKHLHQPESKEVAMTAIPKLTAEEAAMVRVSLIDADSFRETDESLYRREIITWKGRGTDLGRAALAAYDAAERAKIRVEAIDECLKAVERVHDEADEWEWAVDLIESRLLELKKEKP